MAKELPYFQFEPAEYLTKDISFCSLSAQGLFMNICSFYWQRQCNLTKQQFLRRFNYENEFNELIKEGVIDVEEENVIIKFLDLQYQNATKKSQTNSENGSKGGRPKKPKETEIKPKLNPIESETKGIREDKIKEDKINNNLNPINWDALLKFFNTTTNKKCRVVSTKAKNQFNARLKDGFTKEDIFKAIKNCYSDDWHIKNNHQYLTLEFISRADKLDKFSQIETINTSSTTNQKAMKYDD